MAHSHTSRIRGTGSYVPERRVTNEDVATQFALEGHDVFKVTGIRARHWSQADETCSHLAERAARQALESSGLSSEAVDAILVSTTSPDTLFPSTACALQERLGMRRVAAFDLAASCSGFLYGLSMADAFIRSRQFRNCLVVAAEIKSRSLHKSQPASGLLFGDGAGAVVVTREESSNHSQGVGIMAVRLYSDGACHDLITIPAGGSRHPMSQETIRNHQHSIQLQGGAVYRVAVKRLTEAIKAILRETGTSLSEVKQVITHQANGRMLHTIAKRLGVHQDQMVSIVDRVGNTSSASLPMALDWAYRQGKFQEGDLILLGAFGGGLTWGTALIRW
ncbi:MAG: ketoacyl-ACP synthase III [Nitrospira sp. SB0677_bin_15]|nr:ketoacyl-ACP synthase III [Nitrospira sp. SB0667_bin_9]MYG40895.1 ketoacyl-ACP synthase III [Nitrospira sp. SB0677_bin_15]MYH03006.1 ketoacyl-ACP synthase III [Nitrospira sp. SB0675_bin_23]MYJ22378.1 ketoacyl-ACP synthase III [Nitrospira sp. SB0673_bin_12]